MQRKEINIFSTSFLDLLSGALGAVLILFIIIPKMTAEQQGTLEEIEKLNVQTEELAELIEQARNSIPTKLYEQIQTQMIAQQNTIDELTHVVQNLQLQLQLQNAEFENAQLREQLQQAQQQLLEAQRQLELEQTRLKEAQKKQKENDGLPSNFIDQGDVEVFILWEGKVDVDLFVKNLDNGETCYYHTPTRSWGNLMADIDSSSLRDNGKNQEIFYQKNPIPGRYLVYFKIYQNKDGTYWSGKPATVTSFAVMFPGKPNEIRIDFPTVTLKRAKEDHIVGTLIVTNNNLKLEQ